ncbi:hypothetical protein BHM03_00053706, partial [Ensete ventricosum]
QLGGGAASHGQPPCRVGHTWPGCGQGPQQGGGQGQPARRPTPLVGASAHKGGWRCSRGQQPVGAAPAGTIDCGQPVGAAAAHGHTRLQRDAHKGGRLQCARKGLPPAASPTASRGGATDRRGCCPLAEWLPTGKGNRHLRRGSSGDADRARGVRASF